MAAESPTRYRKPLWWAPESERFPLPLSVETLAEWLDLQIRHFEDLEHHARYNFTGVDWRPMIRAYQTVRCVFIGAPLEEDTTLWPPEAADGRT